MKTDHPPIADMVIQLRSRGFVDGDMAKDLGLTIPYIIYLHRTFAANSESQFQHQYLSLITYEGVFVEAVFEVYLVPKNPHKPKSIGSMKVSEQERKGYATVHSALPRSMEEILSKIDRVYPITSDKPAKGK